MKRKEAIFILVATFALVICWIIFSIIASIMNSTISETLNVRIAPINPSFNTGVITDLKKRQEITPLNATAITTTNEATTTAQTTPAPLPTGTNSSASAQQAP